MQARIACMVEARLAKKRKVNLGKASVAPITELATRSISAKGASATAPATMFIEDVRAILRQARRGAYAAANHIMVQAYWNIGRRIVREEQGGKHRADYGQFLIRNLARQLGDEFGGGVSVANLKNFTQFYIEFPNFRKGYPMGSHLTWTRHKNCPVKRLPPKSQAKQPKTILNSRVAERVAPQASLAPSQAPLAMGALSERLAPPFLQSVSLARAGCVA